MFSVVAHWNDLYWPLIVVTSSGRATPARRFVTECGMELIGADQNRQQFATGGIGIIFDSPARLAVITGLVGGRFPLRTSVRPGSR